MATLDPDDPFCEAILGPAPHAYAPFTDLIGGKSWLYCTQCGDTLEVSSLPAGTSLLPAQGTPTQPSGPQPSAPSGLPVGLFPRSGGANP
jgi:hypothetical protein